MKKIMTAILMAMTMTVAQAQTASSEPGDVYYKVKNGAELAIQDPNADDMTILIGQFKLGALGFLVKQGVKETNGKGYDLAFMDRKALALNDFITKYLSEISNAGADKDKMKDVIKTYWKATRQHPMYPKYKDDDITTAFASTLLCFNLNTDWEAADYEISNK